MKFKYSFTLATVLIIMFSLTAVVASENVTDDASLEDTLVSPELVDECENQEIIDDELSDDESVDVSVSITVKNNYSGEKYNLVGDVVPWNVSVNVTGGIAKNVHVYVNTLSALEFVSATPSIGKFNSTIYEWEIGDLNSSDSPYLIVLTKVLETNNRINLLAFVYTTSKDICSSNNWFERSTTCYEGDDGSNVTQTTDDSLNSNKTITEFQEHQESEEDGVFERKKEPNHYIPSSSGKKDKMGPKKDSSSDSVSKNIIDDENFDSTSKRIISLLTGSNMGSSSNMRNLDSEDYKNSESLNDVPTTTVKAIYAYDYAQIPILILAFFLTIFIAIVGYDKIKS